MTILHETPDCDRQRNAARTARLARLSPAPKPNAAPPVEEKMKPSCWSLAAKTDRPFLAIEARIEAKEARLDEIIADLETRLEDAKTAKNELRGTNQIEADGEAEVVYPSMGRIKTTVAEFYRITVSDIISSRRPVKVTRPRQTAMYLCHELTPRSYPDIGRNFGGKDHTTVIHAVRATGARVANDRELRDEIAELKSRILWSTKQGVPSGSSFVRPTSTADVAGTEAQVPPPPTSVEAV